MCGIFGITGYHAAKDILPLALMSLQHRGHDAAGAAGITDMENYCLETIKGLGKVINVINADSLKRFTGNTFIAHTRYATRNCDQSLREIHPHWAQSLEGRMAIVVNGDLLEIREHIELLKKYDIKTYSTNDAEIIVALINYFIRFEHMKTINAIHATMHKLKGGYAAIMMAEDDQRFFAFRDPWGIRPLYLAEFETEKETFFACASETCAFDVIRRFHEAQFPDQKLQFTYRSVAPGEVIAVDADHQIKSRYLLSEPTDKIGCVFESIYFSRPDSLQIEHSFQTIRENMGRELFKEAPVEADIVTPVPKSGIPSAIGYAYQSKIPYAIAILEEPSTSGLRSFISNDCERKKLAGMKYNILKDVVKDQRLIVVDDSIVRGTTMKLLVKELFALGAAEVHLRIPCPPYNFPCHYGIETKDPQTLISHNRNVDEICKILGATSLAYLSIDGLYKALQQPQAKFCDECLTGRSPFE